jgi:hypothetical protein
MYIKKISKNINHIKLNKKGYVILKNTNFNKSKLKNIYDDIKKQSIKAKYIFNNKINDKKRKQCQLKLNNIIMKEYISSIKKTIDENLMFNNLKYKKWIILKSSENCEKQTPHLDYIPTDKFIDLIKNNEDKLSYFFINSIEKTQIYVYGKYLDNKYFEQKINIPANSILLMRADLIHAGSDFIQENIRIHCYIESDYLPMKYNQIYKIQL